MIIYKSTNEIDAEITDDLLSLGISDIWSAPLLAALLGPFMNKLEEAHNMMRDIDVQSRLASATRTDLEHKAFTTNGLTRISLLPPEDLTFGNFHFYLPDGKTASQITKTGTGFTINSNALISNGIQSFRTLDDAKFEPTSNSIYVRIRGVTSNIPTIGAGELTQHNISYPIIAELDVDNQTIEILCTNDKEIVPITFNENDDEFRFRVFESIKGRSGINEHTLLAKLREIGVTEYITHDDFYGVGKAGIEIITNDPVVPDPLLIVANERVKEIYPGDRVIRPYYLMTKLIIDIEPDDPAALETTKEAVKANIISHFNTYNTGTTLNYTMINQLIEGTDNVKSGTCSCILIDGYRATLANQRCQSDEKFVLDVDSGEDAVTFAIKA